MCELPANVHLERTAEEIEGNKGNIATNTVEKNQKSGTATAREQARQIKHLALGWADNGLRFESPRFHQE